MTAFGLQYSASGKWHQGNKRKTERRLKRVARRSRTKRVQRHGGQVTDLSQEGEWFNWSNAADKSSKIRPENGTLDLAICPSPIKGIKQTKLQYFHAFAITHAAHSAWVFFFVVVIHYPYSSYAAPRLYESGVSIGNRWHTQITIIRQRFVYKRTNFNHGWDIQENKG